jgi:ligand-binding sensor domain-containing protein
VCVYALLIRAAAGSTFEPQISGYVHRAWTVEQGLPQNLVGVLHASRDGYLWIGASNGIVRFDGLSFTVFDLTNTPALTSNRIGTFHEGTDGTLWILDVPELQDEGFGARIEVTNGLTIGVERSVYWDANGVFWSAGTNAVATRLP